MTSSMRDAALILIGERGEMTAEAIAVRVNLEDRFKPIRAKWRHPITRDQVYAAMSGLRSKSRVERTYIQPVNGKVGAGQRYQLTGYGEKHLRHLLSPGAKVSTPAVEHVDHPAHYGGEDNPYEAIKVIEAWELPFNTGNTVKYISRAGRKSITSLSAEEARLQDLKKARWYLDREIANIEGVLGYARSN